MEPGIGLDDFNDTSDCQLDVNIPEASRQIT
jgi:hypothetical protein